MKKLTIVLVIIAAFFALYLPKDDSYAFYFKILAIVILMVGVMRLMRKVPSKNQSKDTDDVS
jgi:O-antigen/teichoic acid export membrane protein